MKTVSEVTPFKLGPQTTLGLPSDSWNQIPLLGVSKLHIILSTVLMVTWMTVTSEFDKPCKQTESKMQVTGNILSNKLD